MLPRKSTEEYYAVLGLRPSASPIEIRRAYHKLVRQWHPDRFMHDPRSQRIAEEKLKEINEAHAAVAAARRNSAYPQSNPPYARSDSSSTYYRHYQHSRHHTSSAGQARSTSHGYGWTPPRRESNPAGNHRSSHTSPIQIRAWFIMMAWMFVISLIHGFQNNVTPSPPKAAWPDPRVTFTPITAMQESEQQRQKEVEDAIKAARLNMPKYWVTPRPAPSLDYSQFAAIYMNEKGKDKPAVVPEQESPRRNYPVPPGNWPGFTLSTDSPAAKAPAAAEKTPGPAKDKIEE